MHTFSDLLDALRARAGSDRKAAAQLGLSQNAFSAWRRGIAFPEDDQAARIAAQLGLDPAYVFAIVRAARARSKPARETWQRVAEKFKNAAVVAVLAIGTASFPTPGQARTLHLPNCGADSTGIHIVRNRRRWPANLAS